MSCPALCPTRAPVNRCREMKRALNIALRTAHIGAMGVLLGGHAFDVTPAAPVTAIVTERGLIHPVSAPAVRALIHPAPRRSDEGI